MRVAGRPMSVWLTPTMPYISGHSSQAPSAEPKLPAATPKAGNEREGATEAGGAQAGPSGMQASAGCPGKHAKRCPALAGPNKACPSPNKARSSSPAPAPTVIMSRLVCTARTPLSKPHPMLNIPRSAGTMDTNRMPCKRAHGGGI